MKTVFKILLLFLMIPDISFGQELHKYFELQHPDTVISNSLYNSIDFIDSRVDTSKMGIVQVGVMNHHAKVITEIPLSIQLNEFLSNLIDSSAGEGQLLLQIRHFLFAETTNMTNEIGYCYLKSNLYAKVNDSYKKIVSIDTFLVVKKMDVTNSLLKSGSTLITDLILKNLKVEPHTDTILSYKEIAKIDSIEKSKIKVFNTDKFVDGLYYSYDAFKNQIPDKEVFVKIRYDLSIAFVKVKDPDNKWVKMHSRDFYAFVYQGKPYISTGYGYYPIYKHKGDLIFVGIVKPNTKSSDDVIAATVMFGLIGGIIASNSEGSGENYFIIIDHTTGEFIQARKMPTQSN